MHVKYRINGCASTETNFHSQTLHQNHFYIDLLIVLVFWNVSFLVKNVFVGA